MRVAFGFKAHSGWAALIVLGREAISAQSRKTRNDYILLARRRVELVNEEWAKQPYHAAKGLEPNEAQRLVKRGIDSAQKIAARKMREAIKREQQMGNTVVAAAVLTGDPMPGWSVAEILAVHFRMHQAEGVLFRQSLLKAALECALPAIGINEKLLMKEASSALKLSTDRITRKLLEIGKAAGPPWGKDQKDAALAAMIALSNSEY